MDEDGAYGPQTDFALKHATARLGAPKVEGGVLQEMLNDIGPQHHDDWEMLKVDNWIGPKTTDAFGKVLKSEDADRFTSSFGRALGLL